MSDAGVIAALRIEYAAARLDLQRAMDSQRATRERLHQLANRVQSLYLKLYALDHGLKEDES